MYPTEYCEPPEIVGEDALRFTLSYDGLLPACTQSDNRVKEKHAIRKELSYQLEQLWQQEPVLSSRMKDFHQFSETEVKDGRAVQHAKFAGGFYYGQPKCRVGDHVFLPLVTVANNTWCELEILLLRDGDPGHVLKRSGDLDNRLKLVFDALRMPHVPAEIPAGDGEKVGLMFCLLEDDSLITKLTVETQRRLRRRSEHATYVEMRIGVRLVARKITPHNRDYMNT